MKTLAPIALFVYNRPEKTKEIIHSLKNNKIAKNSSLFIFSDASKSSEDMGKVLQTRKVIKKVSGFKNIQVFEALENKGLANSIIDGVTQIINKYKKIIVLEDDLLLSEDFLEYMNEALEIYENNTSIWSITGYSPPIYINPEYGKDLYLSYRGCSWSWGTWKDRWDKHDWGMSDYHSFMNDPSAKKKFQLGGNDLLEMLRLQAMSKMDSWAIRSCYSQFRENNYTIYPVVSKVQNNGFGENSTHCTSSGSKYKTDLSEKKIIFQPYLKLDVKILNEFKKYYDLDLIGRIGYYIKRHDLYKYFKWTKNYLRR